MNRTFEQRRYLIPFRTGLLPQIFCDTLVLGSGVAGLRSAVGAAHNGQVIVLAKDSLELTNTAWAQGGIAAVLRSNTDQGDSVRSHIEDTLTAGAGLCDPDIVELICTQAGERIEEIIDWGMRFDRDDGGHLMRGREGGHNAHRVYHSGGDATGAELQRTLLERTSAHENIRLFDRCFAIDLLTLNDTPGSPVLGAMTWHPKYGLQVIWARTTIMAMGGAGQVFRETTNPRVATADGIAMGYRAGAQLADMEFVQFHPTTLYVPGAARSLISEAVRGEGHTCSTTRATASCPRFMSWQNWHPVMSLPVQSCARSPSRAASMSGSTAAISNTSRIDSPASTTSCVRSGLTRRRT